MSLEGACTVPAGFPCGGNPRGLLFLPFLPSVPLSRKAREMRRLQRSAALVLSAVLAGAPDAVGRKARRSPALTTSVPRSVALHVAAAISSSQTAVSLQTP